MPNSEYQVFLSYHEQDQRAAEEIATYLRDRHGIIPWLRAWSVVPGRVTREEQERGLTQSHACAILIGQTGIRDWQQLEMYASIQQRVETEGSNFPVIPVFLPDCPDEIKKNVPTSLRLYEPVTLVSLDDEEAIHRLACGIYGEPLGSQGPADIPCPYPGLDPFREDMSQYFYGREEEIGQLQEKLETAPFVLVMGPSGSGKSSIVLAGLLPRLKGGDGNSSTYLIHTFTPGREPLQSLARAINPERRKELAEHLSADPQELSQIVQDVLARQPRYVRQALFVVDQFEEVFTLCDNTEQRDTFIHSLLHACKAGDSAVKVVFTLRSDFYTPCFDYPQLINTRYHLPIALLRGEQLRRAIEDSARTAGLYFQRGLVDTLLDDAGDELGILPLIQYALRQLFNQRNGRWLTADAYHTLLGGVRGVIATRAEAALAKLKDNPNLDPKQVEPIVRRILLRLVQVSENSPPTRQEVAKQEFFWASDTEEQRALLEEGLQLLIQERLLTSDEGRVNLAHEVIIKSWKRLADWVDESMEDLLTRRRVEEAAREWDKSDRDDSLLFRGVQLQKALEWQERRI
jgi:energy-coupling factor transporter ATP-binding protein EcfA2